MAGDDAPARVETRSVLHRYTLGCALMLFVSAVFGGYAVVTNKSLKNSTLSPLVFALGRDLIGSVCLLSAAYIRHGRSGTRDAWKIHSSDSGYFILLGMLGVWGAQGLSAMALKYTTATFFGATSACQPVVALCVALVLRLEAFDPRTWTAWGKVGGILLSISAAILLVVSSTAGGVAGASDIAKGSSNIVFGAFTCGLQVLTGGSFPVAQRRMLNKYSAITTAAWSYVCGTCLLILCVIVSATEAADWAWTPTAVGGVFFAGVLASGVNYFLLSYIINLTTPVLPSAGMAMNSVFTAIFSWVFLGQKMSASDIGFSCTILAGLVGMIFCQYTEKSIAQEKKTPDVPVHSPEGARLLNSFAHEADDILNVSASTVQTGWSDYRATSDASAVAVAPYYRRAGDENR